MNFLLNEKFPARQGQVPPCDLGSAQCNGCSPVEEDEVARVPGGASWFQVVGVPGGAGARFQVPGGAGARRGPVLRLAETLGAP